MSENHLGTSSNNSFLNKLQNKLRSGLNPTTTKTTFPDGSIQFATDQGTAVCKERITREISYGFVVDDKPDLSVGIVKPWLLVSSQDVPMDVKLLKSLQITHILSLLPGFILSEESRGVIKSQLTLEIFDEVEFTLNPDVCRNAFKFIEEAKYSGGKVLVHCNAGVSRAPSIVIAFLICQEKLPFDEAWETVKKARQCIKPNDGFLKQLQKLGSPPVSE